MRAGQRARIVGRHEQAGLPVGAHHLGQRAPRRGDHGHAARHRLDGRQREAFVERGHDGHLGLAVEAGQLVVGDAAHAVHGVGQTQGGRWPARPGHLRWDGR